MQTFTNINGNLHMFYYSYLQFMSLTTHYILLVFFIKFQPFPIIFAFMYLYKFQVVINLPYAVTSIKDFNENLNLKVFVIGRQKLYIKTSYK